MNNEKILATARKNKNIGKEYENKIVDRSYLLGCLIAMLVCVYFIVIEYISNKAIDIKLAAILWSLFSVPSLYEGIKNRKLHLILIGVIFTIMTLGVCIAFII